MSLDPDRRGILLTNALYYSRELPGKAFIQRLVEEKGIKR